MPGASFEVTATGTVNFSDGYVTGTGRSWDVGVFAGYANSPSHTHVVADYCCLNAGAGGPGPVVTVDPPITEPCGPTCEPCGTESFGRGGFCPIPEVLTHGNHTDYLAMSPIAPGCGSCGGASTGGSVLPGLKFNRKLIPNNQVSVGNLSPGMFFDFDMRLSVFKDSGGDNQATLFDPCTEKTFIFTDGGSNGSFDADLGTYFDDFNLVDSTGATVADPASTATQDVFAVLKRKNGTEYRFEICSTEIQTDEFGGRLLSIKNPQGFETTFTYKSFTQAQITNSTTLQFQIDTITDPYSNVATCTYATAQQLGRWVIENVDINSGLVDLDYSFNTHGHLSEVQRNSEVISTYTYGIDTLWDAATITFDQRLWNNGKSKDTLYLSDDYTTWDGKLVNQFANALIGRGDGTGYRYLSIARAPSASGVYRINYKGQLIQWQRNGYWRYFESFTDDLSGGYDAYSGTMESVFAHHPDATTDQITLAKPETVVDETGYTTTNTYGTGGNTCSPTQTDHPDGSEEIWAYDSNNQVTYYKDREDFVTTTERDANNNIVRIARGMQHVSGPGTETATTEAVQDIFGYYPSGHQNEGLLKWQATTAYAAGAVVEPPADERTDYIYDSLNRLIEVRKPKPHGQSARPVVKNVWSSGRVSSSINEHNETTSYTYDVLDRITKTTYPDGSTEQTWYDDVNDIVYRKDRNNLVSKTEYDAAGRVSKVFTNYGVDQDLTDSTIDTTNSKYVYDEVENIYQMGRTTPSRVQRNGHDTLYEFDYRNRNHIVKTRAHTYAPNKTIETVYVDNMVLSVETSYSGYYMREYSGYSADRRTVRKIRCRVPTVTFADNQAVMDAVRVSGPDPDHTIVDAIRDKRGDLVITTDVYGNETRNDFDALGRQTETIVGFGTALAMTSTTSYDEDGNVTQTVDPAGAITQMTYDPAGNVISQKVAVGVAGVEAETLHSYHIGGKLKTRTLPSGGVYEYFYEDCCHHSRGTKDPYGHGQIVNLNAGGQTVHQATVEDYSTHTSVLDPTDAKTLSESTMRYGDDGKLQFQTTWKSALGVIDPADPPIAGIDGVAAADGVTTQYVYFNEIDSVNSGGQPSCKRTIDRLGGGTFEIDIYPAVNRIVNDLGNGGARVHFRRVGTQGGFEIKGSASVVISPDEKTMQVSIQDGVGRNVMNALMTGPAATTPNQLIDWSCTKFDLIANQSGFGDVQLSTTLERDITTNRLTKVRVDGFGWNIATYDIDNNLTRTKFDEGGKPLEIVNALNKTTSFGYDDLGRQTTVTNPLGHVTTTVYDASTGRVSSRKDAKNNTTSYTYDVLGRIKQTTDRTGKITSRTYDVSGNLETLTDAESRTTTYDYDLMNRRTEVELNAIGMGTPQKTTYAYDPAGRQEKITYHSGESRTNVFEFSGVLDRVEYRDSSNVLAGTDDFSYDSLLRRSGSTSADGVVLATTYTDRGQVDTETTTYGGQSYVVDYDYDDNGRVTKITYPSGRAVEYSYTSRSELDKIKWNGSQIENRAYDAIGRLTSIDRTAVDETRTYDDADRLTSIVNTNMGTASYTYDDNNNKLSETFTGPLSTWGFSTGTSGYDAEDRFTEFERSGQSEDLTFTRSDIGNINLITDNNSSTTVSRTLNEVHQLTGIGGNSQTYDSDGNLATSQTGISLTWGDGSQRLMQAVVPSTSSAGIEGTHQYGYDSENRRTFKTVHPTGGSATTTVSIHAGPNKIAEYTSGAAASNPGNEYICAQSIDSLVALAHNNNSGLYIVARNQQWSVIGLLANSSGTVSELYSYNVFGNRIILEPNGTTSRASSSYGNPFGYTGREHDTEIGMMYFRARYYDPLTGEFSSQDQMEYVDGMSLYRAYFVTRGADPLGLWQLVEGTKYKCLDDAGCTLKSLASTITGDERDWVCIWPTGENKHWKDYPEAKKCATADVANLVASAEEEGTNLRSLVNDPKDAFVNGLKILFEQKNKRGLHRWSSGKRAASKLKAVSGQGATPIGWYVVGGHCGSGKTIGDHNGGRLYGVSNVFDVALEKDNSLNSYSNARKRIGPPRCWFCRDAKIYAFGCNTKTFAEDWATQILRSDAASFGTNQYLMVEYEGRGTDSEKVKFNFSSTYPKNTNDSGNVATTFDGVLGLDNWEEFDGQQ